MLPAAALADPKAASVHFEVFPRSAFADEDVRICLRGLKPDQRVLIRATTEDDAKRRWASRAKFRSDASGQVDIATQESLGGSYRGISPMGLFWSMKLANGRNPTQAAFAKVNTWPHSVTLEVDIDGEMVISAEIERMFFAHGSVIRDIHIRDDEFETAGGPSLGAKPNQVARLFLPPAAFGSGPHPVVLVLNGSGGGLDMDKAALLSRHGFATLALAYFGAPPLPAWLHEVPLDYIEAALAWLATQPEIDAERIGVLGVSRGAELALLSASRLSQIRAVVAYSPSSVAWDSGGRDKRSGTSIPAWTWRGEPVPFLPMPLRGFKLRSAFPVLVLRRPIMFRNMFRAGLRARAAVDRAAIPVENVHGPILLISGGDDHVWPAAAMCESIEERLKRRGFAYAFEHAHYPRAGHMLRYPHLATTSRAAAHPNLRSARFSYGGTAAADAEAQADSWRRSISFLKRHL
jgi:dienelactone hydrolase